MTAGTFHPGHIATINPSQSGYWRRAAYAHAAHITLLLRLGLMDDVPTHEDEAAYCLKRAKELEEGR